jgi:hypothetical protein
MAFNPLSLLFLTFRGRSVAVFRDHCSVYDVSCLLPVHTPVKSFCWWFLIAFLRQGMLAVTRRTFRSLQDVPAEDIVLLAAIPGYPVADRVELSKDIWSAVSTVVHNVTVVLESGAFSQLPPVRTDDAGRQLLTGSFLCLFVFSQRRRA